MARITAKMSSLLALVLLLTSSVAGVGLPLLSYIKPCLRTDPQLNECAKKHANEAIPHLVKGAPDYHIPVLDPFLVKEVKLEQGSGPVKIDLKAYDLYIEGFKDAVVRDMSVDLPGHKLKVTTWFPKLKLKSKYSIEGQVLVLPINGEGNMTLDLDEVTSTTYHDHTFFEKEGVKFVRLLTPKIDYNSKSGSIHFTNLFKGDKALGDNMNKFLNENWQEVITELGPTVSDVIRTIVDSILQGAVESTPFDLIYPEKL